VHLRHCAGELLDRSKLSGPLNIGDLLGIDLRKEIMTRRGLQEGSPKLLRGREKVWDGAV